MMPFDAVIRPIPSVLDEVKVASLMEALRGPNGDSKVRVSTAEEILLAIITSIYLSLLNTSPSNFFSFVKCRC